MFQPSHAAHPKAGRPAGSETSVKVPKYAQRTVVKQLAERAKGGDQDAVNTLALIMIKSGVG